MRKRWPESIKERACGLRERGYSYGQITKELGVAKSTLFAWLYKPGSSRKFTKQDKVKWARQIQPLAVEANRRKRADKIAAIKVKVEREISSLQLDRELLKMVVSCLYWAEGSKGRHEPVRFANTDPRLMLLFITLLRRCYRLDERKFRVKIYLHHYHDELRVTSFWSELLSIPKTQFNPVYRKARNTNKTFRRNFGGICFLKYNDIYLKEELMAYAFSLAESLAGKVDVPVA